MIDHFQRQVDHSTPTPGGGGGGDDEGEDELDLYMPTYLRPPKNATQQATGVDDDNDSLISEDDVEENADDWWHDSLSTLEANAILSARAAEDGWFLVRGAKSKSGKDVVVLSCVFKGQPTHHLITENDIGLMNLKRPIDGHEEGFVEAEEMITYLKSSEVPNASWPVRLTVPVGINGPKIPAATPEQPEAEPQQIGPEDRKSVV